MNIEHKLECCIRSCCFNEYKIFIINDTIKITDGKVTKYLKFFSKNMCFAKLDKIDGPAIETTGNYHHGDIFYIKGQCFFANEFAEKTKHLICKNCKEFCKQNCF